MSDDGEDEPLGSKEDDSSKTKSKSATSKQNEKLYAAEGILNTKLKRAEKRKKSAKADAMDDDDYDFKVDYKKKDADMDVEDGSDGKVPMSGVEFDGE